MVGWDVVLPDPCQQTLGTDWLSCALQDSKMGVGRKCRELWALETNFEGLLGIVEEASVTSGPWHKN